MKKIYPIFGSFAALIYIAYVVIGGALSQKGYSHLIHAISELPHFVPEDKFVYLSKFTLIYGIALIFFSILAFIDFKNYKSKLCRIAFVLILLNSLSGIMMAFFPMDERDTQVTALGMGHLVLAGFCAVFSILTPLLAGIGFKRISKFKHLAVYSIVSSIIIFVSGGITAAGAANQFKYFGIVERITIGTYIIWILVISIQMLYINSISVKSNANEI
ncbi:MAG: DUF998 domain-containing protein [Ruminiclostridium sp.]